MSETPSLKLPLLQPSQAQKHVTVNEALVRLDGLAQITIQSLQDTAPPASVTDGDCYAVPAGASQEWSGHDGRLAVASNGGWVFVQPREGWSAWIVGLHSRATYLQGTWQPDIASSASNGGRLALVSAEAEHTIVAGGEQFVDLQIPEHSMVIACSARVVDPITGSLVSWDMDIAGQSIVFGTGMGLSVGSYCTGMLSQPATLYAADSPRLSPVGGSFGGGRLIVAAHYARVILPA